MSQMSNEELSRLVDNDREWRLYLIGRIDRMQNEVHDLRLTANTLKLKIGFFSFVFGGFAALVFEIAKRKLN